MKAWRCVQETEKKIRPENVSFSSKTHLSRREDDIWRHQHETLILIAVPHVSIAKKKTKQKFVRRMLKLLAALQAYVESKSRVERVNFLHFAQTKAAVATFSAALVTAQL